jgi:hypothetical protein
VDGGYYVKWKKIGTERQASKYLICGKYKAYLIEQSGILVTKRLGRAQVWEVTDLYPKSNRLCLRCSRLCHLGLCKYTVCSHKKESVNNAFLRTYPCHQATHNWTYIWQNIFSGMHEKTPTQQKEN